MGRTKKPDPIVSGQVGILIVCNVVCYAEKRAMMLATPSFTGCFVG